MTFDTPCMAMRDLGRYLRDQEAHDAIQDRRDEAEFRARRHPEGARLYRLHENLDVGSRRHRWPGLTQVVTEAWEDIVKDFTR